MTWRISSSWQHHVVILTDCRSLAFLKSQESGRVARWFIFLQQYHLTIYHIDGRLNKLADWLSRNVELTTEESREINEMVAPVFVSAETISSPFDARLPLTTELIDEYQYCPEDELRLTNSLKDGLRYGVKSRRLYIPPKFRGVVIYWFHYSKFGGHQGVNSTVRRMRKVCWWPTLFASWSSDETHIIPNGFHGLHWS